MAATKRDGAAAPGPVTPTSDEAPSRDQAAQGFRVAQEVSPDFPRGAPSRQALRVIEGERKAGDFLARLHARQADPDELALIVSMLYGATLRGFCRALEKALGGAR